MLIIIFLMPSFYEVCYLDPLVLLAAPGHDQNVLICIHILGNEGNKFRHLEDEIVLKHSRLALSHSSGHKTRNFVS
jgi:hypothetical protein